MDLRLELVEASPSSTVPSALIRNLEDELPVTIAPVDARDPEGETPYQPRLDDFAGVIEAVKQMIEADRDAD